MNSQDVKNAISGVLVVDKPVGMTSHDVVQAIRNGTGLRRAGHTGTLDPRASGVLVVLVGPAVRLSEYVSASDKRYQAIIRLGGTTDTFDAEGRVTESKVDPMSITEAQFEEALKSFVGEIEQTPPPYSAVKVRGRKAYEMARKGEEVELEPRKITVHHLEVLEWTPPEVVIDVHCSSGTYVRSLANDLGENSVAVRIWSVCAAPRADASPCVTRFPCENCRKPSPQATGINTSSPPLKRSETGPPWNSTPTKWKACAMVTASRRRKPTL
jgi:tRNA pseudouridine(55) synthase